MRAYYFVFVSHKDIVSYAVWDKLLHGVFVFTRRRGHAPAAVVKIKKKGKERKT